jgi:hypothetical protein
MHAGEKYPGTSELRITVTAAFRLDHEGGPLGCGPMAPDGRILVATLLAAKDNTILGHGAPIVV